MRLLPHIQKISPSSPAFQKRTSAAALQSLRADLNRTLNIQAQLFTQYQLGSVSESLFTATNANIQDRINELSAAIVSAERGLELEQQRQQQREWFERYAGADLHSLGLAEKREFLAGIIERITVQFLPEQNAHELRVSLRFQRDFEGENGVEILSLPVTKA